MFAWADIRAHEERHEEVDQQAYQAERPGDRFDWEDFAAWRAGRPDSVTLRPFLHTVEGLAYWQLELRLNDLGRAFLLVDEFAHRARRQLTLPEDL